MKLSEKLARQEAALKARLEKLEPQTSEALPEDEAKIDSWLAARMSAINAVGELTKELALLETRRREAEDREYDAETEALVAKVESEAARDTRAVAGLLADIEKSGEALALILGNCDPLDVDALSMWVDEARDQLTLLADRRRGQLLMARPRRVVPPATPPRPLTEVSAVFKAKSAEPHVVAPGEGRVFVGLGGEK